MNSKFDQLKILAMVTMLIDHLGVMFFPELDILRLIGRISYPLFVWGIVLGVKRTRSFRKYLFRLGLLALISQLVYVYFNPSLTMEASHLNIIFSLILSAILVKILNENHNKFKSLFVLCIMFLPIIVESVSGIHLSYGSYGMILTLALYQLEKREFLKASLIWILANAFYGLESSFIYLVVKNSIPLKYYFDNQIQNLNFLTYASTQSYSILALVFLLPKQEGSRPLPKWLAYGFYPVHMLILIMIKWYGMGG